MHSARALLFFLLVATPVAAHAHGQQVLLFPVGQSVALLALGSVIVFMPRTVPRPWRWLGFLVALLICVPMWFVPGAYIPDPLRHTGWGNFLLGLLPPFLLGGLVSVAMWCVADRPRAARGRTSD